MACYKTVLLELFCSHLEQHWSLLRDGLKTVSLGESESNKYSLLALVLVLTNSIRKYLALVLLKAPLSSGPSGVLRLRVKPVENDLNAP